VNISLSPELERLIAEKLRSGRYRSADEVIREGLALLHEKEKGKRPLPGVSNDSQSLVDVFAAIARDVPESEWAALPSGLSKNLDHYLYGSEKIS
jgi:putative addiction module CopG family antidote